MLSIFWNLNVEETMTSKTKTVSSVCIEILRQWKNPYPKDIFTWDNQETITLKKGRFNQFIHSVVENTRESLINEVEG
jgi:hypothetical protein